MTLKYYGDTISDKLKTLAIIPAAGMGTRVGSPAAKELLPHPDFNGTFLDAILERCRRFKLYPLVISRDDKHALNQVLQAKQLEGLLSFITLPATKEWTFTVSAVSQHFAAKNILLLPDASFHPEVIISDLLADLEQVDLALATFPVEQAQVWGCVESRGPVLAMSEKPKVASSPAVAWGLLAFRAQAGRELFELYKQTSITHDWIEYSKTYRMRSLYSFIDLQR
jgi:dTDP-glucose pyrophosphorylase